MCAIITIIAIITRWVWEFMSVTSVSVEQTSPTFFASQTGVMLDGILRIGLQRLADKHNEITDQREGQKDTDKRIYSGENPVIFQKSFFFLSAALYQVARNR